MMDSIQFFVPGEPKTAGSKRAFVNPKTGKPILTDACKKSKPWKADVKHFAFQAFQGEPLEGPLYLRLTFYMPRPKSHYRSGKHSDELKPDAPSFPDKRPDVDKLSRAVMDALTGVLWNDDSQVVTKLACKRYGGRPGVDVVCEWQDECESADGREIQP